MVLSLAHILGHLQRCHEFLPNSSSSWVLYIRYVECSSSRSIAYTDIILGYAWPLYNVVTATRTIIFDTHSRIGLNFGILFARTAVSILFFPFACLIVRTKTIREKKKEVQKKKHEDDDEGNKYSEG